MLPAPQFGLIAGGQGGAQAPSGLSANAAGTSGIYVSSDGGKPTYGAVAFGQTFYSTAAAVLVEIQGSATRTIRIKQIAIWLQGATGAFAAELLLQRCTTVGGGTPTAVTGNPFDINDPAATAVVNYYTAASAQGTGHLPISARVVSGTIGTAGVVAPAATVWDFTRNTDKALILRGTTDWLEVYNTTTGFTGTDKFGFSVEWEEDLS